MLQLPTKMSMPIHCIVLGVLRKRADESKTDRATTSPPITLKIDAPTQYMAAKDAAAHSVRYIPYSLSSG
jgi:hypothetical protein